MVKVNVSVVLSQLEYFCFGKEVSMELILKCLQHLVSEHHLKMRKKVEAVRISICRNMLKYETIFLTGTTSGCRVTSKKYPNLSSCCFSLPSGPFYLSSQNESQRGSSMTNLNFSYVLFFKQAGVTIHSICQSPTNNTESIHWSKLTEGRKKYCAPTIIGKIGN